MLERSSPAVGHRGPSERAQLGGEVVAILRLCIQPDDPASAVGAETGPGVTPEAAGDISVQSRVRVMDELERIQDANAVDGFGSVSRMLELPRYLS